MRDKCAVHKTNSAWGNLKRHSDRGLRNRAEVNASSWHRDQRCAKIVGFINAIISHADQLNEKYEENKTSSDALAGLTSTQRKKQCACGTNEPIQQRRGHLARAHCSSDESKPEQRSCGADHGERGAVETAELKAERGVAAGPNRGHGEGWGRQWLHAERRASSTSADVPGSSSGGLGSEREQYAAGSARCRNPVRRGGMGTGARPQSGSAAANDGSACGGEGSISVECRLSCRCDERRGSD